MLKEKVLITGAGGALAKKVKQRLLKEGYAVVTLTTDKKRLSSTSFYWNVGKGEIDKNALQGCHHIVHLAGFSIVKPWTKENQQKMHLTSRPSMAQRYFTQALTSSVPWIM